MLPYSITNQIAPPIVMTMMIIVMIAAPTLSAVVIGEFVSAGFEAAGAPAFGLLLDVAPVLSDKGIMLGRFRSDPMTDIAAIY